ncbi:MAG TPA: TraB/GumN family protein, partial [Lysobacter sp.]|nr:TraB/GumN family protein [Lysobacter sp.]
VAMRQRANAWAIGDIDALRSIPLSDQAEACMGAATRSGVVRKRTQDDIAGEMMRRWVDAVRAALANNDVTFAMMPLRDLLKTDGPLATLQAEGYAVEAPE